MAEGVGARYPERGNFIVYQCRGWLGNREQGRNSERLHRRLENEREEPGMGEWLEGKEKLRYFVGLRILLGTLDVESKTQILL